jgi:tetratricopeptide (TPR) repeat protein
VTDVILPDPIAPTAAEALAEGLGLVREGWAQMRFEDALGPEMMLHQMPNIRELANLAIRRLAPVAKQTPTAEPLALLAECHALKGIVAKSERQRDAEFKIAAALYEKSSALEPGRAQTWFSRGVYGTLSFPEPIGGGAANARQWVQKAVDLRPDWPRALCWLAAIRARAGERKKALETIRKLLTDHPSDPFARRLLRDLEAAPPKGR